MPSETSQDLRVEIVSDPQRIKALIDENRLGILRALREGITEENDTIRYEMTVPEIAQRLGKKAPNLYHHADVLVEHGFLEVARQEQKKRSFITYYRRTKPVFIRASEPESELAQDVIYDKPLVAALARSLDLPNEVKEELKELMHEYRLRRSKAAMFFTQEFEKRSLKPIAQEQVFEAINIIPYFLPFLDDEMVTIARRIIDLLGIKKI